MNQDELIYKWLNHELNADELEAFKMLEDYHQLTQLNRSLKGFKAPEYTIADELKTTLQKIEVRKSSKKRWLPVAASIAAIFVLCFGFLYYTTTQDTSFETLVAQKENIYLPDGSSVQLNAMSQLSFNEHQWDENREVNLDGEAFFKVIKGSKFEVTTTHGTISVLGTQFNIKHRNNVFEVVCYEGLVNVRYNTYDVNLPPGDRFLIRDGKLIATEKETFTSPSWIEDYSRFKSVPYNDVLAEFERQYDVKIDVNKVDITQLFTGSFSHNNMEVALKSITLPLQLTYSKTNRTITLKRE